MNRLCTLSLAAVAVLSVACAGTRQEDTASDLVDSASPIVHEGAVYTPASRSAEGCVLYSVRIPGGQAPAALVYRSKEGRFTYGRPDRCVTLETTTVTP